MDEQPVISVKEVVKSFDGRRVLDGINLDVRRGETMVIMGVRARVRARSCGS
jgi:ABC-type transporter Mla maintaining outer membrane lipid asymmetry ATPase subunit MlaF